MRYSRATVSHDRIRAGIVAILILTCLWQVFPDARRLTMLSARVARLPRDARRAVVLGEFWPAVRDLDRRVAPGAPVAIVMRHLTDVDRGTFVAYYLYPRVCRYYFGIDQYQYDTRPTRAAAIAYLDLERSERVRLMTYDEVRAEEFGRKEVVASPAATSAPSRDFVVPMVASIDGPPPDVYKTEAVLLADEETTVVLTLQPTGTTKTLALHAKQPLVLRDLVHDSFGRLDAGWLHVQAATPIRGGFWFVNAGTSAAAPVPLLGMPRPMRQTVRGGDTLWLANTADAFTTVRVNGAAVVLPPRALQSMHAEAESTIDGAQAVIAFATNKLPHGGTAFHWPESGP
jgi:hypothetical protein